MRKLLSIFIITLSLPMFAEDAVYEGRNAAEWAKDLKAGPDVKSPSARWRGWARMRWRC